MINNFIYHISFPKLNIHINLSPVAFIFGNFNVRWYGIILAIGFLLGYLYVLKHSKKFGISKEDISNLSLISSFFAIICARVYYILFYPGDFYLKNPLKIFMISEGGIAIYGAIIGGVLSVLIFSRIKKINVWRLLDIMSLGTLIGQTVGRWGNFVNQEAFGTITNLPWGMMSENTGFKVVHPCFLYESTGCLLIFIFLHFYNRGENIKKEGNVFLIYTLFYGILRASIEKLRTDSLMIPNTHFKASQVLALILSLCSFVFILKRNFSKTN